MEASGTTEFSRNRIEHEFMQWIMKWYYTSAQNECQRGKPNAMFLIYLLKAVGCQLEKFEKSPCSDELKIEKDVVKITIECGTSKTKALLSMDNVQWPPPNVINNTGDFFWSVSGTEPTGTSHYINKFEIGSNLLPQMAPETFQLLKDVCQGLMETINTINESTGASKGLRSLEHQPEEIKPLVRTLTHTDLQYSFSSRRSSMTDAEIQRIGGKNLDEKYSPGTEERPEVIVDYHTDEKGHGPLIRQRTYDADRSTPVSSRSVTDLSMSSLISLPKPNNAVNCLQMAKAYIDQVLKILPNVGDVSLSSESFDSLLSNSTFRKPFVPGKSTTPKKTSNTGSGSLLLASLAKPMPSKTAAPANKTGPTALLKQSPKIQRSARRQTIGGSAFKTVTKPTISGSLAPEPSKLSRSSSSLSFKGARIGVPVKKSATQAKIATVSPHTKVSTPNETTSPMNSAMSRLLAPTKSSMLKRSNTASNLTTNKSGWKI